MNRIYKFVWVLCNIILVMGGCDRKEIHLDVATIQHISFHEMKYPYPEKTFGFQDQHITYIDTGMGDPILFLHGQASDLLNFEPVYPLFESSHRILALDYPGFGKSDKPEIQFTEKFFIDLIDEFLATVGVQKVTLVGHSFGGYVAMVYGVARPERVNSMVLISTAGIQQFSQGLQRLYRKSFTVEEILNTTPKKTVKNYWNGVENWTPAVERYAHRRAELAKEKEDDYRGYAHAMVQAMELMLDTTIRDKIGAMHIPTLILWGKQDSLIPYNIALETLDHIPHARLETLDQCGHFPMLEYPDTFHTLIHSFLKEQT